MNRQSFPTRIAALLLLSGLLAATGCDHVVPEMTPPDSRIAASLAASSKTAALVDENLDLALVFDSPMGSTVEGLGLNDEADDFDPWTGGGVNFPERAAIIAAGYRSYRELGARAAKLPAQKEKMLLAPGFGDDMMRAAPLSEPGDTISVEYFDTPDSSGLNALIMVEPPSLVRFVSLRSYPDGFGPNVIRRDSEVRLDTMDTWEDGSDDLYYSIHSEEEWDNGMLAVGDIAPESGEGPLGEGVVAVATHHVDQPMFHPLQAWVETVVTFEPNAFDDPLDDVLYSISNKVHWISDAEITQSIRDEENGPITPESTVAVSAAFTAAPGNPWLESTTDALRAQLGDLEDEEDDLLLEMSRDMVFDGIAMDGGNPRSSIQFVPETPVAPGEEPCGGEATEEVYYPENWWLLHLLREADINCDGSGSLHVFMEFLDGSSWDRLIVWDGAGGATLTEERPDGTVVTGTWNEATGDYEATTTFPAGHDPIRREQSGQIQEGGISATDEFVWQDGHLDRTSFEATESESGYTISGDRWNGDLTEHFTLAGSDGMLEGSWSRTATGTDASGDFTLEELEGGGGHLIFSAQDPAAEGEPSIEGESWFAPDGSGHGTLTITQYGVTVTYHLVWEPGGTGVMSDADGNQTPLG